MITFNFRCSIYHLHHIHAVVIGFCFTQRNNLGSWLLPVISRKQGWLFYIGLGWENFLLFGGIAFYFGVDVVALKVIWGEHRWGLSHLICARMVSQLNFVNNLGLIIVWRNRSLSNLNTHYIYRLAISQTGLIFVILGYNCMNFENGVIRSFSYYIWCNFSLEWFSI